MDIPLSPEPPKSLYIALSDQLCDGPVLRALCSGEEILSFTRDNGAITVAIRLREENGAPLSYELRAPVAKGSLTLYRYRARIALYADDALADEEWPLAEFPEGEWTLEYAEGVPIALFSEAEEPPAAEAEITRHMHLYAPEGHNAALGDCMPYWDGERFHLFYLYDRRSHKSKNGLGAHRWAHLSTADMRHWTRHPIAIDIDEIWEGSICTGSFARWQNRLYAFYAVRMADRSAARITWAVSEDGVRFQKSGVCISLKTPYDAVSARDPLVFLGPDGKWNMLVTTSIQGVYEGGCLAWLQGDDPVHWTQKSEPFLAPGYPGQPECPDWFCQNGVYTLVFSSEGVARYRVSDSAYGPWRAPQDDMLTSAGIRVPKTAAFGNRRVSIGFLPKGGYAGEAVFEELTWRQSGDMQRRLLPETLPLSKALDCASAFSVDAPCGLALYRMTSFEGGFRLRGRIRFTGKAAGVILREPDSQTAILEMRITEDGRAILKTGGARKPVCERMLPEFSRELDLDIVYLDGAAYVACNGASLTARASLSEMATFELDAFALWGEASFSSVALEGYAESR